MVKVEFKLNGRSVRPNNIANQLERAMLKQVQDGITKKLRSVRDPETGAAPTVKVIGRSLNNLSFEVAGSPTLIEEVKRRLR
ncbi:hypothetical protein KYK30_01755 [Shinella yambaruensis]|uniref:Uncharacterized protein n=1 Tax=Shinella yambaruensis TaxID=415996 RepID=A0ABQ5ZF44_9HYPH|nr:hypothetical protein [Shinella yambaruensis]MCJ8025875.1 hypothetical protein [Shinella yambaruensis]MCU7978403.1 hypothetical protein [Shinella yambaruensis]GLR50477.1 hypothetical protein GCM10007923_16830 [Shinella yambaruensis]